VTPATRLESIQERVGLHGPWRSRELAIFRIQMRKSIQSWLLRHS